MEEWLNTRLQASMRVEQVNQMLVKERIEADLKPIRDNSEGCLIAIIFLKKWLKLLTRR